MLAIREMFNRKPTALEEIEDALLHPLKKPGRSGGIIVLVLFALGVYWMLPEIRRYLRIERM